MTLIFNMIRQDYSKLACHTYISRSQSFHSKVIAKTCRLTQPIDCSTQHLNQIKKGNMETSSADWVGIARRPRTISKVKDHFKDYESTL